MPHRFARHRDRHLSRTGGRTQNRQYNRDTPIRRPDCRRRHAHLPHVHQPVGIRLTTENFFGSSSNRIHAIQHRPHAIRFNTDGAAPREGESHDRKNRKRQAPRGYRPDRPRGRVLAVQPGRAHGRADTVPMLRRDDAHQNRIHPWRGRFGSHETVGASMGNPRTRHPMCLICCGAVVPYQNAVRYFVCHMRIVSMRLLDSSGAISDVASLVCRLHVYSLGRDR